VATRSKRNRLITLLVVLLIAAAGAGVTSCHSKATGGELMLTAAAGPGVNAFMPPAAPPPTSTQPPPTLQPQGDGNTVESVPLPGDRDGLYGGTDNNAGIDRDKIIDFYSAHPTQAGAFVESLNIDNTVYWSGGRRLTVADIPAFLRELTPALLRLDTRITNHGFDGAHPNAVPPRRAGWPIPNPNSRSSTTRTSCNAELPRGSTSRYSSRGSCPAPA
jgi:hypothetical protein